jgi:hypothetical protein
MHQPTAMRVTENWKATRISRIPRFIYVVGIICLLSLQPAGAHSSPQSTWIPQNPCANPSARVLATTTYDEATSQLILFGGEFDTLSGPTFYGDTWIWSGTSWAKLDPPESPSARSGASMSFDSATGQLILFGGLSASGRMNDTWIWSGSTWTELSPADRPMEREDGSMAFDPATGQLVLFGGNTSNNTNGDTWLWTGTNWVEQLPVTSPSAREGDSLAYDSLTGQLVLFGGFHYGGSTSLSNTLNDTWNWTGSTWNQLQPGTSPPSRMGAAITFDTSVGKLVLFGGGFSSAGYQNDTWDWDGNTWSQEDPSVSPPARYFPAYGYDPLTEQYVVFGGESSSGDLRDTWTYREAATTAIISPPHMPPQMAMTRGSLNRRATAITTPVSQSYLPVVANCCISC